jgi:putative restriction endonuclease
MTRFFGTPPDVHVGQQFIDRRELHEARVHRPLQAGISGTAAEGADSIVVSGGYVDDQDHGEYILYTGHGGNDRDTRRQIADQSPTAPGNAALITSMVNGYPVRVVRGAHKKSGYAPLAGYQYAGLFTVSNYLTRPGRDGFLIIQFRLDRLAEQAPLVSRQPPELDPAFATTTVSRRIRDSVLSREIKAQYGHACQVCGTAVPAFGDRLYAEGAHVRPLGRPHLGSDSTQNILCLCPNHHTQLDFGGMVILNDFSVASTTTLQPFADLKWQRGHGIDVENAVYHRSLWIPLVREPQNEAAA